MKKADNFDAKKWLVENKITFQSRLNEDEVSLSPNMQKQFDMIVSALKKAKSEKDISQVHTKLMLLPKKLTKIFIDKLIDMGLADREEDGKYSLSYDDGLDEENIADFLNTNIEEFKTKIADPGSSFEIIGDEKVATAGNDEGGIDVSFDKEHMLELFPENDPYNEVEEAEIAGRKVYYNNYL